jgi:hypothetical protein
LADSALAHLATDAKQHNAKIETSSLNYSNGLEYFIRNNDLTEDDMWKRNPAAFQSPSTQLEKNVKRRSLKVSSSTFKR